MIVATRSTWLHALGWEQSATFEQELAATVKWYTENQWWWRKIRAAVHAVLQVAIRETASGKYAV
ncbi:MAG: hypothetical protein U0559_08615 [Anaerolineae bacterium]